MTPSVVQFMPGDNPWLKSCSGKYNDPHSREQSYKHQQNFLQDEIDQEKKYYTISLSTMSHFLNSKPISQKIGREDGGLGTRNNKSCQ